MFTNLAQHRSGTAAFVGGVSLGGVPLECIDNAVKSNCWLLGNTTLEAEALSD